jgi:hypothetical protein
MMFVPVVDETVELVVANGAELEPGLTYMEDEGAPEILDDGPVVKAPMLLYEALEPVESGTEAWKVLMIPPELEAELVGNGGKVELDEIYEEYTGEVPVGMMILDFVFE